MHAPGPGALYFVDVSIRRATWAEKLFAFMRPDGSTLVPRDQVVPPGSSFEARHEDGLREMARSEKVAAAVALKQAGFKVKTTNKGALVEAVAVRRPCRDQARRGRRDRGGARQADPHPGPAPGARSPASIPATTSCSASGVTASSGR